MCARSAPAISAPPMCCAPARNGRRPRPICATAAKGAAAVLDRATFLAARCRDLRRARRGSWAICFPSGWDSRAAKASPRFLACCCALLAGGLLVAATTWLIVAISSGAFRHCRHWSPSRCRRSISMLFDQPEYAHCQLPSGGADLSLCTARTSAACCGRGTPHRIEEIRLRDLDARERLAWLRLARTPEVGPATFAQLIARFGSASSALEELPRLARRGGGKTFCAAPEEDTAHELDALEKAGGRLIALLRSGFSRRPGGAGRLRRR